MKRLALLLLATCFTSLSSIAQSDLTAKFNTKIWASDDGAYLLILVEKYQSAYLYHEDSLVNFYDSEGLDLIDEYTESGKPETIALTDLMFQYGITTELELVDPNEYVKFDVEVLSQREERVHLCSQDHTGHMMMVTWFEEQAWYNGNKVYKHKYRTHDNFKKERYVTDLMDSNAWLDKKNNQVIVYKWAELIAVIQL